MVLFSGPLLEALSALLATEVLVSDLFVAVAGGYILSFLSIPLHFSALKMSFLDAFPEWSPLCGKVGDIEIQLPFWASSCNSYTSFLNHFLPILPP